MSTKTTTTRYCDFCGRVLFNTDSVTIVNLRASLKGETKVKRDADACDACVVKINNLLRSR